MRARALPVTTKRSQVGDGVCAFEVTISTWSPLCSCGAQRQQPAVDLGADAGVADLRMHRIGEIDRRRAARQRDQIALRGEGEDLVLEHLELGVLEELLGVRGVLEDVEQLAQPAILPPVDPAGLLLVDPVRGDAEFGDLVHVAGADLHLDALPLGPDHAGVQRAVIVRLRGRDVVLEAARERRDRRNG